MMTYEEFAAAYRAAFLAGNAYAPHQIGFLYYVEKMAMLADEFPAFLERLEAEEDAAAYGPK